MASERAVSEVQPNDLDEQARDTVNKGWSKDQWISGVLERAIGIVARSAEKRQQEFALEPWAAERCRYSVSDDKALSTYYERAGADLQTTHLKKYFPIKNIDVVNTDARINSGEKIHIQGQQRPDSISLLKLTTGNSARKVCICFEGDGHDIDATKTKEGGMYLYEKMFQDASLCQDLNPQVPAIFITSALFTHEDTRFPVFQDWSAQFLKTHVVLVERLLQYVAHKTTSWIHAQLVDINAAADVDRTFDFFCWINAVHVGDTTVEKSVEECNAWMDANERNHHQEYGKVFAMREKFYSPCIVGYDDAADGLLKNEFKAFVLKFSENGMPVVIFAVPRLHVEDARALAQDGGHSCSGLWYPQHVDAYVNAVSVSPMKNFLVPLRMQGAGTLVFNSLRAIRHTTAPTALTVEEFERDHKDSLKGQFIFALPWLWMNIAFLCILKSSLKYKVATKAVSTLKAYVAFTRRYSTQISSRDTVQNAMKVFSPESTSLFSHVCRQRSGEVRLEGDLVLFLEQKCGWTDVTAASSPAVFFKLIGACNLITAHTLAKQAERTAALREKVDKVKDAFPLGAQVEVDYALECLSRHYYFVQDKGAALDGFVTQAEFDAMQRALKKQVLDAQRGAPAVAAAPVVVAVDDQGDSAADDEDDSEDEEEESSDDEVVDDNEEEEHEEEEEEDENKDYVDEEEEEEDANDDDAYKEMKDYAVGPAYTVQPTPSQGNIDPKYLIGKRVAVRYKLDTTRNPFVWCRGIVEVQITTGGKKGRYHVRYAYNGSLDDAKLVLSTYGCDGEWVLLNKIR
jgi:hypothetical protein